MRHDCARAEAGRAPCRQSPAAPAGPKRHRPSDRCQAASENRSTTGSVGARGSARKIARSISSKLTINASIAAAIAPGRIAGNVTSRKAAAGDAPRFCAASSSATSRRCSTGSATRTTYGVQITRCATISRGVPAVKPIAAEGERERDGQHQRRQHERQHQRGLDEVSEGKFVARESIGGGQAEQQSEHGAGSSPRSRLVTKALMIARVLQRRRKPVQCQPVRRKGEIPGAVRARSPTTTTIGEQQIKQNQQD